MRINPCKGEWLHLWVRLNKSSMRVCVTLVISLKSCDNFWWFFPPCVYRNTWVAQKHTCTTIVIHSTVRFSVSHPVPTVGSCPNKGALHSFIVLFSSISHTNIHSPQWNTSNLVREHRHCYCLWPNRNILSTNWQSASSVDNAHKLKNGTEIEWVCGTQMQT